jgi:aminopeptidase N
VTSWYGERFANFPWSSLNIIQLDKDFGGGYAPLSSVFMYRDVFGAQPGTGFWQQTVELTAHELGHQWWGNFVEPYSVGDVALSESLAEESSCWYTEKTLDSRSQLIGNHLSYLYTVPPAQDVAVGSQNVYNSPHYVPVVYHKGSAVLDMLRAMIGDEAMAKGLALYAKSFARDYARLDDLRKAMEEASGQKLTWFWQQWFNKTGPIRAEVAGRLVNNGGKWAVRLRFAQPAQGSSPSAPAPKRFSVDVTIDYADSTQDVIAVEIAPEGDEPVIAEVPVKAQPVRVRLDVQRKLLRMWATATPGDFNFSGLVDGADLVELALRHGRAVRVIGKSGQEFFFSDTAWNELYDLQPDLRVDMLDVEAFSGWVGTEAEQF